MQISSAISQLRTTDLAESIRFYTTKVGLTSSSSTRTFTQVFGRVINSFTQKLVDEKSPSIEFVDKGEHFHLYLETDDVEAAANTLKRNGVRLVKDVHETAWGTREFVIKDDQGHTLYFGQSR
jgi:catechol 2,3-dioxygenase-like lactoylglutathione lyase family enzyme